MTPPRITGELAGKVYRYQLHVFRICIWLFCTIPCILLVIYLFPAFMSFMGSGPQRSSMIVVKLLAVAPILLLFAALLYFAILMGAVFNVFCVRLLIPALRMPDARPILLQCYTDPRWLYPSRGARKLPWWISLGGGMGRNKHLIRLCKKLTVRTIDVVYGGRAL